MNILILGGTGFLGPHIVESALAQGWTVTLFNRGKSAPGKFPTLETLLGDRDPNKGAGLSAIESQIKKGRRWDAVIDTSAYVPRVAKASASLLAPAIHQYVFVSTVSVYGNEFPAFADESTPVSTMDDPTAEAVTGMTYGPLKALCEQAVRDAMPAGAAIVRPGLIVGPGDPTDRFTYWPVRIARGGDVLVPAFARPDFSQVSFIDVRDLADFTLRLIHDGHDGTYNATGPAGELLFAEMTAGCKASVSVPVRFVEVGESFLLEQGVQPWMGLPLWIPQGEEGAAGEAGAQGETPGPSAMGTISRTRAIDAGLSFRPLAVTSADTIRWWDDTHEPDADFTKGTGLSKAREAELLARWRAR